MKIINCLIDRLPAAVQDIVLFKVLSISLLIKHNAPFKKMLNENGPKIYPFGSFANWN